jgi:hypothetical protein
MSNLLTISMNACIAQPTRAPSNYTLTNTQWTLACDSLFIGNNALGTGYLGLLGLFLAIVTMIFSRIYNIHQENVNKVNKEPKWLEIILITAGTIGLQIWSGLSEAASIETFFIPTGIIALGLMFGAVRAMQPPHKELSEKEFDEGELDERELSEREINGRNSTTRDIDNVSNISCWNKPLWFCGKNDKDEIEWSNKNKFGIVMLMIGWIGIILGLVGIFILIVVEYKGDAIAVGVIQTLLTTLALLAISFGAYRSLSSKAAIAKMRQPIGIRIVGLIALGIIISNSIGILLASYVINKGPTTVTWPTYLFGGLMILGSLKELKVIHQRSKAPKPVST